MTGNPASDLISRGFSIFPITEGVKYPPLVSNWPARASNDPDQIELWTKKFPGCNWGIHCKDLVVLDADIKKKGIDTLAEIENFGEGLPATLEVETPSGGRHLFYKGATVRNGVNVLGPGIDIRSDHGYVVASGSTNEEGDYRWIRERPVATVPDWVIDRCGQRKAEVLRESPEVEVDQERAYQKAAEYLARTPIPEEGGRDVGLIPVAAQLKDLGLDNAAAMELMQEWASDMSRDGFSDEQFEKCIRQGYKTENAPGSKSAEALIARFPVISDDVPMFHTEPREDGLYTPYDVSIDDVMGDNYLVKGWLDRGTQAMLFGRWGAGKTFNAISMAAHIAAGEDWFGNRVRQGSVLFLGYEGAVSMKRRLFALREEHKDWDWETIPFYIKHMSDPLVNKRVPGVEQHKAKGAATLENVIQTIKGMEGGPPDLIIIDPLRNALGGSDSDVDYTQPYIEFTKTLIERFGCTVLTLHHPGHGEAERSRGDSGLEAAMDSVIRLDGDLGKISSTKQRDNIGSSVFYNLKQVELARDSDGDPVTTCVVEHMTDRENDPRLTTIQQEFLNQLTQQANDQGQVTKGAIRTVGDFSAATRGEIINVLERKRYLLKNDKGVLIEEGPGVAMFS